MMERKKKVYSFHKRGTGQGPSNRRRPAIFAKFAGMLVLAVALSSVGLASGAAAAPDLERSNEASALRWARLGEAYEAARAEAAATAMTNRFTALAAYYGFEPAALAAGFDADTLRWFRLGEAYAAARAEAAAMAMTNRYKALAEYCNSQSVTTQALLCSADYGQLGP